jgi:proton glutamate symport protein
MGRSGPRGFGESGVTRIIEEIRSIGLPARILSGAILGIIFGIVLGDRAAVLAPLGSAYAMLLQIAVYPYLICSLLQGLGRLPTARVGHLVRASWRPYVFIWCITLAVIWLLSRAIPASPPPSLLIPALARPEISFLDLVIPANPFESLYRNDVPAIVLFAVIYGLATQGLPTRQTLFDVLEVVRAASIRIWNWIVWIAPLGVFALFADTAGTIRPDQLGGLLLYITLFLVGTAVLAFVVLPLVLSAVASTSYRDLLAELQPALVLAAVTTLSVVALPFVQRAAERIVPRSGCPMDEETSDVIQTSLSLSYVFAQLGNYFSYLLILYAAFAAKIQLTSAETLALPFMSLVSGMGSPSATINGIIFLAHWLHLPDDTVDLYVETATVTRYGQVILSVIGFSFVTITVPLIYHGKVRLRWPLAATGIGAGAATLVGISLTCIALQSSLFPAQRENDPLSLRLDPALAPQVLVSTQRSQPGGQAAPQPVRRLSVRDLQEAGVLRVGYNPEIVPFSYWNADGDLVGFDIAYARQLAGDLGVRLELIPFSWQQLPQDLLEGRFDIAVSGIYLTYLRLTRVNTSRAYYHGAVALIVPSDRAVQFTTRAAISSLPNLRLAVMNDPVLLPLIHHLFPQAGTMSIPDYGSLPSLSGQVDGAVWTLPQAAAWAAAHPGWTAVAPEDIGSSLPFAYMMPPDADNLRAFVDQWLDLKADDGFRQRQIDYWILGKSQRVQLPRWSLLQQLSEMLGH